MIGFGIVYVWFWIDFKGGIGVRSDPSGLFLYEMVRSCSIVVVLRV